MSALEENYSENEDDPQVYESSGDEWSSASDVSVSFITISEFVISLIFLND